jgi:hypothetical protein
MSDPDHDLTQQDELPGWLGGVGFILTIAYPTLAISVGFRAVWRIVEALLDGSFPPTNALLSGLTATLYVVATVGFARKARWAWRISLVSLSVETALTFVIGTLSLLPAYADAIGRTAWRAFGQDYGYLPLLLPIFGLIWLLHPLTRRIYAGSSQ